MMELEMAEDRLGTVKDLAYVVSRFKMPGDGLIPDYQERLHTTGAGISTRLFVQHGLFPILKTLGTSSAELKHALRGDVRSADFAKNDLEIAPSPARPS
jgi:acyl-[acyl-carrier-protein] desaturase